MCIFQFEFQMKGIIGIKVTISHITENTLPMMQAFLKTRMILSRILVYPTMKHLQTQTIVTLVKQVSNSIFTKIVKHCELNEKIIQNGIIDDIHSSILDAGEICCRKKGVPNVCIGYCLRKRKNKNKEKTGICCMKWFDDILKCLEGIY